MARYSLCQQGAMAFAAVKNRTFIYDIGGAKKALQKCLTDSALIGSNRLTINSSEDNSSWKKELLDILIKLIDFNKKISYLKSFNDFV